MNEDRTDHITGTCLCGRLAFSIDPQQILLMNNCHCTNCQKESGTGYVTMLQVPSAGFQWLRGADHLDTYASTDLVDDRATNSTTAAVRARCRTCGARAPSAQQADAHYAIPAGLMDQPLEHLPQVNMWVASKANWVTLDPALPSCEQQGSEAFWHDVMADIRLKHRRRARPQKSKHATS